MKHDYRRAPVACHRDFAYAVGPRPPRARLRRLSLVFGVLQGFSPRESVGQHRRMGGKDAGGPTRLNRAHAKRRGRALPGPTLRLFFHCHDPDTMAIHAVGHCRLDEPTTGGSDQLPQGGESHSAGKAWPQTRHPQRQPETPPPGSGGKRGPKPKKANSVRKLVLQMAEDNPSGGSRRIPRSTPLMQRLMMWRRRMPSLVACSGQS